jgi:hypothetical protein
VAGSQVSEPSVAYQVSVGELLSVWQNASARQTRTNEFALHLHDRMAPEGPSELAKKISMTRSTTRKEFCGGVVASARIIVQEFEADEEWGLLFDTVSCVHVLQGLSLPSYAPYI